VSVKHDAGSIDASSGIVCALKHRFLAVCLRNGAVRGESSYGIRVTASRLHRQSQTLFKMNRNPTKDFFENPSDQNPSCTLMVMHTRASPWKFATSRCEEVEGGKKNRCQIGTTNFVNSLDWFHKFIQNLRNKSNPFDTAFALAFFAEFWRGLILICSFVS